MMITEEIVRQFAAIITEIYDQILVADIPEDALYRGFLDSQLQFALDNHGYRDSYTRLFRKTFSITPVADLWSEDALNELGHQLLLTLAKIKLGGEALTNTTALAKDWLTSLAVMFPALNCYTPVVGLTVEEPIQLGQVTFLPLEPERNKLVGNIAGSFLQDLNPQNYCLASSTVSAEWRRSTDILRERVEQALNVLRYFGSLVWYNEPPRHIYLAGHERKRVSYSLAVDSDGLVSRVGSSEFSPITFNVDTEFLRSAKYYDFDYIRDLLASPSKSEIELAFLTSIQWYGDAIQDIIPLFAFVKYYVSIEAALKKPLERAKSFLPRRLSVLLSPWDKQRQRQLELNIGKVIEERNSVLHSGLPINSTPKSLTWDAYVIARQALHQLRLRIKEEKLTTKDELIQWIDNQYNKWLQ